jgi:hypothetical protein
MMPLSATEESLWDACDNLELRSTSQPSEYAWNPPAFQTICVQGDRTISTVYKVEGTGSIHWVVNAEDIPAQEEIIALHRSYRRSTTELVQLKFHIKCEDAAHPAIYMQFVNYTDGKYPVKQVLAAHEVTNGWKEVTWNLSIAEMGSVLWYLRFYAYSSWFDEGEKIDLYIDNLRFLTADTNDMSINPDPNWSAPNTDYIVFAKPPEEKGNHYTVPTDEKLAGYWRMEEASWIGADAVMDFSGKDNHGQAYNGLAPSGGGKIGRNGDFDGYDDYIGVPSADNLKYTGGEMSVSCWFKMDEAEDSDGWIFSKPWNSVGEYNWFLRQVNGYLQIRISGATYWDSPYSSAGLYASKGVWHHAAFTVDSNKNVKIYLDGILGYSGVHNVTNWVPVNGDNNCALRIGSLWGSPSTWQSFCGFIDEAAVYNSLLSGENIERLYNAGRGRIVNPEANILLFATPEEYENGSFCIRPLNAGNLTNVDISVPDDLVNAASNTIPKEKVKIQVARLMKRWFSPVNYEQLECYLEDSANETILQGKTKRYWITVEVPSGTLPGIYTSRVRIAPQGETVKYLPLTVEVLPFTLEDITANGDIGYFMYYSPALLPASIRTQAKQLSIFQDMRNHGMTTASLYLCPVNDDLNQTQTGYLAASPTMDTLGQSGLVINNTPVLWLGCRSYGSSTWKVMLDAGVANSWPEMLFYGVDEPSASTMSAVINFDTAINNFKTAYPQYSYLRTTTAGADYDAARSYYDVWIADIFRTCDPLNDVITDAENTGKLLWSYDCELAPTNPEIDRYYFGFLSWKAGLKGCAHWAYNDTFSVNRFYSHVYVYGTETATNPDVMSKFAWVFPTATKNVPSVGWEAVREGVDDFRYLQTLLTAIAQCQDQNLIDEAEGLVDYLAAQIHIDRYKTIYDAAKTNGKQDGRLFDRESPEVNLEAKDYNMLRYLIVDMIKRLKQ